MTPLDNPLVLRRYCVGLVFALLALPQAATAQDDCWFVNDAVSYCSAGTPFDGITPDQGGDPGLYYVDGDAMLMLLPAKEYGGDADPAAETIAQTVVTRFAEQFDVVAQSTGPTILTGEDGDVLVRSLSGTSDDTFETIVVLVPLAADGVAHRDAVGVLTGQTTPMDDALTETLRGIVQGFRTTTDQGALPLPASQSDRL